MYYDSAQKKRYKKSGVLQEDSMGLAYTNTNRYQKTQKCKNSWMPSHFPHRVFIIISLPTFLFLTLGPSSPGSSVNTVSSSFTAIRRNWRRWQWNWPLRNKSGHENMAPPTLKNSPKAEEDSRLQLDFVRKHKNLRVAAGSWVEAIRLFRNWG